jgi:hypothetical protein
VTDPSTLPDDELLAAIATWEASRAERWASVSNQKGAAYEDAYARYMIEKTAADAALDEARRRRLRRRGQPRSARPRTPPAAQGSFRYRMHATDRLVTATADGAVQLSDALRAPLAEELRAGLRGLRFGPGEPLYGCFAGELPAKTDVENRLLTNIAVPEGCLRGGFAFEHQPEPPAGASCGYEYRPVDPVTPFEVWRPAADELIAWEEFELSHGMSAPAVWWQARARRGADTPDGGRPARRLMLRINVASPGALGTAEIKAVTDGLLAAAQWMPAADDSDSERFHARLRAAGVDANPATVVRLLRDPAGAPLGPCERLVYRDGRVSPDDHLVVAGIVAVTSGAGGHARIRAAVHEALPVSSP